MNQGAIYLITGLMASGKSTIAQLLATKMNKGVHLRGDVFRRMIVSGRVDMSKESSKEAISQLHLRYHLATEAAKIYYDNGFAVILQDNYYGEELIHVVDMLGDRLVHVIVLCPDVETIKKREQLRGKIGYIGFTPDDLYESFMRDTPKIGLWLDTREQSPEETVENILHYFEVSKKLI